MTFTVHYTDRDQPDSSAIDRAWHNSKTNTLTLELHGTVYEYYGVDEETFEELLDADSPGTYYRNHIRGVVHGDRLGPVSDMREEAVEEPLAAWERELLSEVPQRANGGKVNDLTKVKRVPLAVYNASNKPDTYDYTIQFVLSDGNQESAEREHTLKAPSLDDAIEQMFDFAELFDQALVLKGASVRFD